MAVEEQRLQVAIEPLVAPPDRQAAIPGSKSHTNRALVCAALATGTSTLRGALFADDTEAMVEALRTLGIVIDVDEAGQTMRVVGCAGVVPRSDVTIDVRQSGTTGRFLLPMLAHGTGSIVIDGHHQLRARPFGELTEALATLGVRCEGDALPITVQGGGWAGGHVHVGGSVSSQFLSGLLLSAPCANETTVIDVDGELVSAPYIDLTIATMRHFGAEVEADDHRSFAIANTGYVGTTIDLEPDASAASYFFAAAAITGGRVRVEGLGSHSIQGDLAFVDVLASMGAEVTQGPDWTEVSGTGSLHGVTVDMADFSDTAQTLAVVATFADSPTVITGIDFIRRKETDRIAAVVAELARRGIDAAEDADGMTIHPGVPQPGVVETYDDHRMAMSFALLGLIHPGIVIADPGCVAKTFPHFFAELDQLR
ncbi:MAG: 3-phosphoshikimate 1-carboxyvinyltransferase [Acidimicrobiales bacterium]